jgi:hypothetical protein
MRLDGFEDFEEAVGLLRATGARRESDRVFVIDRDLTPAQVAALLEFTAYGEDEGFLHVEVASGRAEHEPASHEDLEAWWFGRA